MWKAPGGTFLQENDRSMNLWCRLLQGQILHSSLKPQQSPCIVDQHVPEPSFPWEKRYWAGFHVNNTDSQEFGVVPALTSHLSILWFVEGLVGGPLALRDHEWHRAVDPTHTHTHTRFPTSCPVPLGTHPSSLPPGTDRWELFSLFNIY